MTAPALAGRELPKWEREVVNTLVKGQGWRYVPPRGNHGKLIPPDKRHSQVFVSCTPSEYRGRLNWLGQLRLSGADVRRFQKR